MTGQRGRPIGTKKDPNRKRVKNHNGRMIDYQGMQYNKLIKSGYKLNREKTQLMLDDNFTGEQEVIKPANKIKHLKGRPLGTKKDPNRKRVKNQNGRMIDYNGAQNNKLIKSGYELNNNKTQLIPDEKRICKNSA